MTVSMWALGKVSYTEAFVRIAGQMGGGLIAFPLFKALSDSLNLTPFGGPEFAKDNDAEAFLSEFVAMFLLMWAIYIVRSGRLWERRDAAVCCFFIRGGEGETIVVVRAKAHVRILTLTTFAATSPFSTSSRACVCLFHHICSVPK